MNSDHRLPSRKQRYAKKNDPNWLKRTNWMHGMEAADEFYIEEKEKKTNSPQSEDPGVEKKYSRLSRLVEKHKRKNFWQKKIFNKKESDELSLNKKSNDYHQGIWMKNISCSLKNNVVLHKFTLDIPPGHIFGLIGRNGAGKTVTIRTLAGLIKPSLGEILVAGKIFSAWKKPPVSVLLEKTITFPQLTAMEHLKLLCKITQQTVKLRKLQESLEELDIDPRNNNPVGTFSLGMRKRLNIVQTIISNEPILLLDDPLASLDNSICKKIISLLKIQAEMGKTILCTSSEINMIPKFCHRLGILEKGILRMVGTPKELSEKLSAAGFLRLNINTIPLEDDRLQSLKNRMPPNVVKKLSLEEGCLVACMEDKYHIPMFIAALQAESIPIYGLQALDPLETSLQY